MGYANRRINKLSLSFIISPHNSRPKPSNAAALFKQEEAATSAAGAWDFDSSGSDAAAE